MSSGVIFDFDSFAVHDGPGIRLAVYFKGCPLRCAWCHSPESQEFDAELVFYADRCIGCGRCQTVCQHGVHRVAGREHRLDRSSCAVCGDCVSECPSAALEIKGYRVDAAEIVERARRMKPFFDYSGGGITLTGGEVTAQPEFALEILRECRAADIHTALETCGACSWETLSPLSEVSDLILYDLKIADPHDHARWTGNDNRLILDNLGRLAGEHVQIRVPLIPGVTDTEANLLAIRSIAAELSSSDVEYLPYNESAAAKYEWLGRDFALATT